MRSIGGVISLVLALCALLSAEAGAQITGCALLDARAVAGGIELDWCPVAGAVQYHIARESSASCAPPGSIHATVAGPPFADAPDPSGITFYRVSADDGTGPGPWSNYAYAYRKVFPPASPQLWQWYMVSVPDRSELRSADDYLRACWGGAGEFVIDKWDNDIPEVFAYRSLADTPDGPVFSGEPFALVPRESWLLRAIGGASGSCWIAGSTSPRIPPRDLTCSSGSYNLFRVSIPPETIASSWRMADDVLRALYPVDPDSPERTLSIVTWDEPTSRFIGRQVLWTGTDVMYLGNTPDFPLDPTHGYELQSDCRPSNPWTISYDPPFPPDCQCACLLGQDCDGDTVEDALDDCVRVADPAQSDTDGDGLGDVCDEDDDADGVPDLSDCAPLDPAFSEPAPVVSRIRVQGAYGTTLYWWEGGGGLTFDVLSGWISELRADHDFRRTCLLAQVPMSPATDSRPGRPVEDVVYYLVRARNGCGPGPLQPSTLVPDPRAALQVITPPACP